MGKHEDNPKHALFNPACNSCSWHHADDKKLIVEIRWYDVWRYLLWYPHHAFGKVFLLILRPIKKNKHVFRRQNGSCRNLTCPDSDIRRSGKEFWTSWWEVWSVRFCEKLWMDQQVMGSWIDHWDILRYMICIGYCMILHISYPIIYMKYPIKYDITCYMHLILRN